MQQAENMVNIGCGSTWHEDWINLDLVARSPQVRRHDLRRGLPFGDGSVDVCYSSHVLEHLDGEEAEFFIREQRRVLTGGGIIRVVVPDLEQICRNYLEYLERTAGGEEACRFRYRYSRLELFDQMMRTRSGGKLGRLWRSGDLTGEQKAFILQRHGEEAREIIASGAPGEEGEEPSARPAPRRWRRKLAKAAVWLLAGEEALEAFREGLFRRSGEVHLQMYDRLRLRTLLADHGFVDIRRCGPRESAIPGFDAYRLDATGGEPRKPDSLYMEARAPSQGADAESY